MSNKKSLNPFNLPILRTFLILVIYLFSLFSSFTAHAGEKEIGDCIQTSSTGKVLFVTVFTLKYDTLGNLTSLTDANGNTTTYTYNGNNELTQELLPDGNQTNYTYDTRGNIHTKTDPNGTVTTYTYDSLNRITRKDYTLATGVGGVTYETYAYDARGHLTTTNNSDNNQSIFTYDTLGNLTSETSTAPSQSPQTTSYTYDAVGNKTGMHTPNGRTLVYTYDNQNRLIEIKEGNTTIASYTYDSLNLTSETLGNNIITNYTYDNGNRMSSLQSPAIADSLTYDANSNISSKGIESYTYDSYNQLTEAMYGNTRFGTGIQGNAYEYDLMGNRINEQNIRIITKTNKKTGTTTEIQRNKIWNYTTNGLNQYTDVLAQSGTVLVSTGIVDINTGTTTNTGIITNTGTTTNTGITSTGTVNTNTGIITDTGAVTSTEDTTLPVISTGAMTGSGVEISESGSTNTGTTVTDSGTTNTGTTETSTGDILTDSGVSIPLTGGTQGGSVPETDSGTTLIYTETGASDTGTTLIASEVFLADTGATSTGVTTDTGALTDTGVVENPIVDTGALQGRLLYDKNGNLIGNTINNKRQFEYVYDAQNRMVQVNRYNDVTGKEVLISFSYDALGRRTSKKVANVIYEYIYSGNDVIEETQSNINPTSGVKVKKEMREYTYGARGTDDIVAVRYSTYTRVKKVDIVATTGDYYYEKNHLGSIIRITSSTGVVIDEYSYTVFGKAYRKNTNGVYKPVAGANDSPIGNTRLYTGREYDKEISLYYLRARYYDAGLGRFVSRDPIGMRDNVNLYTYVANSPVGYVDRIGLEKVLIVTILGKESSNDGGEITDYSNRNGGLIDVLKKLNQTDSSKYITKAYKSDHYGNTIDQATEFIASQQGKYNKLVILGHSLGGDNAVNIASELDNRNIDVNLLITLDIKSVYENDTIYSNVQKAVNYYQNNDEFPRNGEDLETSLFNKTTDLQNILMNELNGEKLYHVTIDDALSDTIYNTIYNQ